MPKRHRGVALGLDAKAARVPPKRRVRGSRLGTCHSRINDRPDCLNVRPLHFGLTIVTALGALEEYRRHRRHLPPPQTTNNARVLCMCVWARPKPVPRRQGSLSRRRAGAVSPLAGRSGATGRTGERRASWPSGPEGFVADIRSQAFEPRESVCVCVCHSGVSRPKRLVKRLLVGVSPRGKRSGGKRKGRGADSEQGARGGERSQPARIA